MDPLLILPEEVRDKIFSNLNERDLKEASKVSKQWYNIIGHSATCMKKLCLKKDFEDSNFDSNNYESIMNSNRQYQNLTIITAHSKKTENPKFLRFIRAIIDKFSNSIVSLKVSRDLKPRSDLPKLKVLEFGYGYWKNVIVSNGLIAKAKNLVELKFRCCGLDKKSIKYIQDALVQKRSLKILNIIDIIIIKELNGLNLKELRLNNARVRNDLRIVKGFLNTQILTLQVIEIPLYKALITYFITNFPNLHTLIVSREYCSFYEHLEDAPEYPANHTITKVVLKPDLYGNEVRTVHACTIISKLQSLQEAYFVYLIPEFLPYLYNCQSLKVVKYRSLCYYFTQEQRNEMARHERIRFIQTFNII